MKKQYSDKTELEKDLTRYLYQAFGDALKSVSIEDEDFTKAMVVFEGQLTEHSEWLEYSDIGLKIELANGKRFELSASEWAQITPIED